MKQVILTNSVKEGIKTHSKLIGNESAYLLDVETEEDYRAYLDNCGYENFWDYCVEEIDLAFEEQPDQVLVQIGDRYYETKTDPSFITIFSE